MMPEREGWILGVVALGVGPKLVQAHDAAIRDEIVDEDTVHHVAGHIPGEQARSFVGDSTRTEDRREEQNRREREPGAVLHRSFPGAHSVLGSAPGSVRPIREPAWMAVPATNETPLHR